MKSHLSKSLKSTLILALCALAVFGAPLRTASAQDAPAGSGEPQSVPGEVLIQFKAGTTDKQQNEARGKAGAKTKEVIRGAGNGKGRLELASLPPGQAVAAAVRSLNAHASIAFAEPNWIYTRAVVSNDTYYTNGNLWGMYGDLTTPANQYGSQAGEAWAAGHIGQKSVAVGVIDEGIDFSHNDLKPNSGNPLETANGLDDDGNGYVDDVNGWDFVNNDKTVYDGGTLDKHGTHVAGTIGGKGGNGTGVAGINWNVTIISGKFLGAMGGTTANAIKAVNYFNDLKQRGVNIVATNNSWGGGGYSQALHDAIIRGAKAGILFVAAAGNDGKSNDTTARYPSCYDTTKATTTETAAGFDAVISVAALTSTGTKPSWSNYGVKTVDLGAPGNSIYSTAPGNAYATMSGTSMATPHVTGAAALYASTGMAAQAIKSAILQGAKNTPTTAIATTTVTGGRLNLGYLSSITAATGTLSGVVTDADTSTPLSGAKVNVEGTGLSVTTDDNGLYTVNDVPVGTFNTTASASGYDSETQVDVAITEGATAVADFALSLSPPPPPTPKSELSMYVSNMVFTTSQKGSGTDLLITVTINQDSDADGISESSDAKVNAANVTLKLVQDESRSWTVSALTNTAGQVTFRLSRATRGVYVGTVTGLTHSTLQWESAMDLNNPASFKY